MPHEKKPRAVQRFINSLLYNPLMLHFLKRKILLLCFLLLPASLLIEEVRRYALSVQCDLYVEMEMLSIVYPMCKLAAQHGDVSSQLNLASMYYDGSGGIPQNRKEAAKWYHSAAKQGDAKAQTILGLLYSLGRGVPKSEQEAYIWYSLAASQGEERAMKLSSEVAQRLAPERISAAREEAARRAAVYQ